MLQKYDFVTGITGADAPTIAPAAAPGDIFVLGNHNQFTIVDSQGAAADVTSCVFSKATYKAVLLSLTIYRSASGGQTRAETKLYWLVNDGTNWEIGPMGAASVPNTGDAGITLTITSAGQLQYVSDANGGSYSAASSWLKWKIIDLVAA